jgi:hypothetical protein
MSGPYSPSGLQHVHSCPDDSAECALYTHIPRRVGLGARRFRQGSKGESARLLECDAADCRHCSRGRYVGHAVYVVVCRQGGRADDKSLIITVSVMQCNNSDRSS